MGECCVLKSTKTREKTCTESEFTGKQQPQRVILLEEFLPFHTHFYLHINMGLIVCCCHLCVHVCVCGILFPYLQTKQGLFPFSLIIILLCRVVVTSHR